MVLARGSERPKPSKNDPVEGEHTLGAIGRQQLQALCEAVELAPEHQHRAEHLFTEMSRSWSHFSSGTGPGWPSDITDDGTPFEFSLAFTPAQPKMRFLVESQLPMPGANSTWQAGLELNARLAAKGLVDLSRFTRVEDLFRPSNGDEGRFLLWHAAVLPESGPALFKAYVNPALRGSAHAPEIIQQALARLGLNESWAFLEAKLADPANQVLYFSLDLHASPSSRVKVYIARHDSSAGVEGLVAGAANAVAGDARAWISSLIGRDADFRVRPVLACFAFTEPSKQPRLTLHVPVRSYLENDASSLQAICRLLSRRDASLFERATRALATRPLESTRGTITYASMCRNAHGYVDVTVYLAPRVYSRAGTLTRS